MSGLLSNQVLVWTLFNILVLVLLALDLGLFHRKDHTVKVKEALKASAVWIAIALIFNVLLYYWRGKEPAYQFLAGYLLEKSLSVDNIFVFLLVFSYFKIPAKYQYKILFYGILGALIMRASLIVVGAALIKQFHWVLYIFGIFLIITGAKMAFQKEDDEIEPEKNPVVRLFKRFYPVTSDYGEGKFFVLKDGRRHATLFFVVLLVVETTDLVFALDSIPAIFGVTTDPFIVYTSNVFAILGLRALYFALAGILDLFHYLKIGLSVVLVFIGAKMLVNEFYKVPIQLALGVIAGVLAVSVIASMIWPKQVEVEPDPDKAEASDEPIHITVKDEPKAGD